MLNSLIALSSEQETISSSFQMQMSLNDVFIVLMVFVHYPEFKSQTLIVSS